MNRFATMLDLGPVSDRRAALLRRMLCGFGLVLFAVTWRLWMPQTVYPQVPLLAAARNVPGVADWLLFVGIVLTLGAGLFVAQSSSLWRRALVVLAAMIAAMMILDQHRIQPWAYQLMGLSLVLAWSDSRTAFRLARWWTVGLYFHSAISKLDWSFLHTVGQQFLNASIGLVSITPDAWPEWLRLTAAALFPACELAIAIGLCVPKARRWAVAGAVAMHLALLVILGPWGLHHRPAVLVWNIFFIAQILILFSGLPIRGAEPLEETLPVIALSRGRALAAQAITGIAVLFPFLEPLGWMDQWPAWGLYAAGGSRATLEIFSLDGERVPRPFSEMLVGDDSSQWRALPLDRWSLETLQVPIYPDARFQIGVAEAVTQRVGPSVRVRTILWSRANRFTGERTYRVLEGRDEIDKAMQGFWLNARPRNL